MHEVSLFYDGITFVYTLPIVPRIGDNVEISIKSKNEGLRVIDLPVLRVKISKSEIIIILKVSNNDYTLLAQG